MTERTHKRFTQRWLSLAELKTTVGSVLFVYTEHYKYVTKPSNSVILDSEPVFRY